MMGAKPLYLTAGFIIEEGFPLKDLKKILFSMSSAAKKQELSPLNLLLQVIQRPSTIS